MPCAWASQATPGRTRQRETQLHFRAEEPLALTIAALLPAGAEWVNETVARASHVVHQGLDQFTPGRAPAFDGRPPLSVEGQNPHPELKARHMHSRPSVHERNSVDSRKTLDALRPGDAPARVRG